MRTPSHRTYPSCSNLIKTISICSPLAHLVCGTETQSPRNVPPAHSHDTPRRANAAQPSAHLDEQARAARTQSPKKETANNKPGLSCGRRLTPQTRELPMGTCPTDTGDQVTENAAHRRGILYAMTSPVNLVSL